MVPNRGRIDIIQIKYIRTLQEEVSFFRGGKTVGRQRSKRIFR
nr:MAG TPA: hypothetical protein [Caudoviricetes sp.]